MDRFSRDIDEQRVGIDNQGFDQSDNSYHQPGHQREAFNNEPFIVYQPNVIETSPSLPGREHSLDHQERFDENEVVFQRAPIRSHHRSDHQSVMMPKQSTPNLSIVDTYSELPNIQVCHEQPTRNSREADNDNSHKTHVENTMAHVCFDILRFISALLIIWDSFADWVIIVKMDYYPCANNPQLNSKFAKYDICDAKREKIRQVLTVFSLFGSIFGMIQIINIILTILKDRGKVKFQLFQPFTEVFISIFIEEIPQVVTVLIFMYNCDCTEKASVYFMIMIASSVFSAIFRFMTSFGWLQCSKDQSCMCHKLGRNCSCQCTIPCPLCSCIIDIIGILCLLSILIAGVDFYLSSETT